MKNFLFALVAVIAMLLIGCDEKEKSPTSLILSIPDWATGVTLGAKEQAGDTELIENLRLLRTFDDELYKALLNNKKHFPDYQLTKKFNPCCPCTPRDRVCCECPMNMLLASPSSMQVRVHYVDGATNESKTVKPDERYANSGVDIFTIPSDAGNTLKIEGVGISSPLTLVLD